ncbi:hypothetical protein GOQ30_08115 [Flavobacterium sp. TP390]|uniref:Lipoprotein n=1 Tax=Flavobacterium profundi TaxID=1774945 RepID=A0A6I4IHT3_9FLAO|nr:hypothetical protein [Flavobacterium profundi]MVO09124.1 hypothetical protein [Flavobacterium profundi]
MKTYFIFLLLLLFYACNEKKENVVETQEIVSDSILKKQDSLEELKFTVEETPTDTLSEFSEIETFYVVVVDTSLNYAMLHQKMFDVHHKLTIPIDTMGRYYNPTKDLITLPEDDEDELYAGDYFPRRFPSETLSLEYLSIYKNNTNEKTIAVVSGIFEQEKKADSSLKEIQKVFPKTFKLKTEMFVGCLH